VNQPDTRSEYLNLEVYVEALELALDRARSTQFAWAGCMLAVGIVIGILIG